MKLSLSHWYPGSGVVLDCIDSDLCPLSYFDKIPAMTLQDIKETKRDGRTYTRMDKMKTVCAGIKNWLYFNLLFGMVSDHIT